MKRRGASPSISLSASGAAKGFSVPNISDRSIFNWDSSDYSSANLIRVDVTSSGPITIADPSLGEGSVLGILDQNENLQAFLPTEATGDYNSTEITVENAVAGDHFYVFVGSHGNQSGNPFEQQSTNSISDGSRDADDKFYWFR